MEGAFLMSKLTNKQKIEIYERRLKGETVKSLALNFNIHKSNIKYLIRLIEKHGYNILRNGKNKYYSKEFKEKTINRVIVENQSIISVSIDVGLTSNGILSNWLKKYKENCYNVIENKRGRKTKTMTKLKKKNKKITPEERIKELEERNTYLEAENEYLKKLDALVQKRELQRKKKS